MNLFKKDENGRTPWQNMLRRREARDSRERIRLEKGRLHWQILVLLAAALLVAVIVEMFNRRSVWRFFVFVTSHPLMFALDFLLIANTMAVSQLFRRRLAVISLVSVFWLAMAITNYVVICFRTQPFTLADVMLVKDMFSLITVYFRWWQIVLIALGILGAVGLIVLMFWKAPRRERVHYGAAVVLLAVMTAMSWGFVQLGKNSGFITERFTTIKDAYQKYGFAYTFLDTFADLGISRPAEYSSDTVRDIASTVQTDTEPATNTDVVRPNIIYVQLESFFDASALSSDIKVSENATPNFHRLLQDWPSGTLYVPVVGGGTANTEFEVLTGMNLDSFGAGEYPYFTVLRDTPCESICYVLSRQGYSPTAVHDYMATFYGRNEVYANLGFDVFESMEYMDDLEYGEIGWAKDQCVTDSVIDAMDATPGRDFIFAVTVGTHGKYPTDRLLDCAQDGVQVLDAGEHINANQLQNYLNVARQMDDFLVEFLDRMEQFDEPVVCVFYGDHLPALDWDPSDLKSGNMFETQYFIWTNYGKRFQAPDLQAYRLSANVLLQLGIEDGVLFRYHQSNRVDDEGVGYLKELEILEFAMLYDEDQEIQDTLREFYGDYNIEARELRMGINAVSIQSANLKYGRLLVRGDNFNEFSTILIDGTAVPTAYIDKHTLAAVMTSLPEGATVLNVAQISKESIELSRTADFPVEEIVH